MLSLLNEIPVSPIVQKLIGAAIIIFLTFLAVFIVRILLNLILKKVTSKTQTKLDDLLFKSTRRYIIALVYLFGFSLLLEFLKSFLIEKIGVKIFDYLDGILYSIGVVVVATIIVKILSVLFAWYGNNIASKTETKVDDEFIPLLDRATKIIIYILAILIVLDHFKVDVKGLLAVLGVGSLAIALAAQDTLANMIGGFVIMIDRPFRNGDWIEFSDGKVCQIHLIGVRSTKFLTFDNTLIIVPNAELMKSTIHNLTYPYPEIKIHVNVGVSYNSDIEQVKRVMVEEAIKQPNILDDPAPIFRFQEFGDSSLNVTIICSVSKVQVKYDAASTLRQSILNRFREEGIEIPFPQRVITFVNSPESTDKKD